MWFIVMLASLNGQQLPTANMAGPRFASWSACMMDARTRALALRSAGAKGLFMCMRPGDRTRDFKSRPIAYF